MASEADQSVAAEKRRAVAFGYHPEPDIVHGCLRWNWQRQLQQSPMKGHATAKVGVFDKVVPQARPGTPQLVK